MAKPLIKIIAFLLVFATVLEVLSLTAFSKGSAATYANKYANTYSFLNEPENSIEIAGVGNSNLYSDFVPAKLWQSKGYTSTIIGSPHQTLKQSYDYMTRLFEVQSPQLIILETDMFYRAAPGKPGNADASGDEALENFFDAMEPDNFEDLIKSQFSVFTFHNRWKSILAGTDSRLEDPNSHGYHLSVKVKKFAPRYYMKETDSSERMRSTDLETLQQIMQLCQKNNAEVLWISTPAPNYWNYERHNFISALAESYGLNYVDYNLMWDALKLNSRHDFRDKGTHLNYNGAKKITAALGDYLQANYTLTDYRADAAYGYWHKSAARFDSDVKALREKERQKKEQ